MNTTAPVFISYAHRNKDFVDELCRKLDGIGVPYFRDEKDVRWGDHILSRVREGLDQCRAVIVVLSPASAKSVWVPFEAGHASGQGKRLLPLLTDPDLDVPDYLQGILYLSNVDHAIQYFTSSEWREFARRIPAPKTAAQREAESGLLQNMQNTWGSLSDERQRFWEILRKSYESTYYGEHGFPETLESLVDRATPPEGVPVPDGEDLFEYPATHSRNLAGSNALLYSFTNAVYPAKVVHKDLMQLSSIPDEHFDELHSARKKMAKFWDEWGGRIYGNDISLRKVTTIFSPHRRIVMLLTYLEISLTQWTQDHGKGKIGLFSVNQDWEAAQEQASSPG